MYLALLPQAVHTATTTSLRREAKLNKPSRTNMQKQEVSTRLLLCEGQFPSLAGLQNHLHYTAPQFGRDRQPQCRPMSRPCWPRHSFSPATHLTSLPLWTHLDCAPFRITTYSSTCGFRNPGAINQNIEHSAVPPAATPPCPRIYASRDSSPP